MVLVSDIAYMDFTERHNKNTLWMIVIFESCLHKSIYKPCKISVLLRNIAREKCCWTTMYYVYRVFTLYLMNSAVRELPDLLNILFV